MPAGEVRDAQERVRRLLLQNKSRLEQLGVSPVVLDAFEQSEQSQTDSIGSPTSGYSALVPDPRPLATSSPIVQQRSAHITSSRAASSVTSPFPDNGHDRSGKPGDDADVADGPGALPVVVRERIATGKHVPPLHAWRDTSTRTTDAVTASSKSSSPRNERKSDMPTSGAVQLVDAPSDDIIQPQPLARPAWQEDSISSRHSWATGTSPTPASSDPAASSTAIVTTASGEEPKGRVSKHAARRQKQFRKRVSPMSPSPENGDRHGDQDMAFVREESLSNGRRESPSQLESHRSNSGGARMVSLPAGLSPVTPSRNTAHTLEDGSASEHAQPIESSTPLPNVDVAASPLSRGTSSSSETGAGTPTHRLPPLTHLPAAPDSRKQVRPAAPPSYFLTAHQESRPITMPALPCPLYGEFDLSSNTDSSFNAFPGKVGSDTSSEKPGRSAAKPVKSRVPALRIDDADIPPLHHSAWVGDIKRLKALLDSGHSPDVLDNHDRTAIMYSCSSHGTNVLCADVLIRKGANLNHQARDGSTALHEAAYVGSLSLIEVLLHNGASPVLRDNEGRLPMHYATYNKTDKCLSTLLSFKKVSLNLSDRAGMTVLMWAAYHDRPTICTYLLKLGAEREEKDCDGRTAMHWAVHKSNITCLKLLLEHDMTYFKDHKGLTVLHMAADVGSVRAARLILSLREDSVNDLDRGGRSPLHWAAVRSRVDVCAVLLEHGASPNLKDKDGLSPLDYAKQKSLQYVTALFTCFDWDSRPQLNSNTTRFSLLSRWSSKVAPEGSGDDVSIQSSISGLADGDSMAGGHVTATEMAGKRPASPEPAKLPDDYRKLLEDGTYMKVFTDNGRGPIQDQYFWVSLEQRHICWSKRRADRILNDYASARAVSVEPGVEDIVKERADYKPDTLHRHALTLSTTSFTMTVLAYTPQHMKAWTQGFGGLLRERSDTRPLSPLWGGDAWGAVNQRAHVSTHQGLFQRVASNQ